MASRMVESRVEPHKKAQFSLHISDRVAHNDSPRGGFSSVKYNHKPAQTSETRSTRLTASASAHDLRIEDFGGPGDKDIFHFTGTRTAAKQSYVLLLDPTTQKATLEPLSDSYTFNLATHNGKDISSQHAKIRPRKNREGTQEDEDEEDLFGEAQVEESKDADASNPYDFRHFLSKEKEKRGDESEYQGASSPDYRTGTGSAANTPHFGARKPAVAAVAKPKAAEPVPKKRRTVEADLFMKKKKAAAKKAQPPPSIHLERRASERPASDAAPKSRAKEAAHPASKIKSSETVHSSDDSDIDGEFEHLSTSSRRSPSPSRQQPSDEDAEGESDDDGGLQIEVPDARPPRPRTGGALKSLGLGQNLGLGGGSFKSPSNGPISLASAANSNQGSPNPQAFASRSSRTAQDDNVIDFGDLDGDAEDAEGEDDDDDDGGVEVEEGDPDVEPMDIGPPARHGTSGHDRKASMAAGDAEDDEEDPLYKEMMAGLAGGDSSEESEEE